MAGRQARVLIAALIPAAMSAAAPEGIPRQLAIERAARVSGVRYDLKYTLVPGAAIAPGSVRITFQLKGAGPLLLDFREGIVSRIVANGQPVARAAANGHLELPATRLRTGANTVEVWFQAPVAPAGRAITRYADGEDRSEYIYTLLVPMDASMAFPCFDQPDLKARFTLELLIPQNWTAIANTHARRTPAMPQQQKRVWFPESEPISTYLFAFAAGPFRKVGPADGMTTLWVRQSRYKRAQEEALAVLNVNNRGMERLAEYFARPFPFSKYDLVLLPGFAYSGMEHAGATFLREEAVLFRTAPTATDRLTRSILLLHELTHQWFGDLVTMRWFDDLWLKEAFATYMAYHTLDSLDPAAGAWKRFYQVTKPAAYAIDVTPGTTPVYQEIANLKDAKSAYGAIVYSKAPGLLRQLAFVIGDRAFRDGVRLFLSEHAFANAGWSDLVGAFERASGRKLGEWADAWIRRRGMPVVTADWACDSAGRISAFTLTQRDALGGKFVWPVASRVLLAYSGAAPVTLRAAFDTPAAPLAEAVGRACPAYVFTNHGDYGYGLFLLDERSRRGVAAAGAAADPLDRAMLWGALWDGVREGAMPPGEFVDLALARLPEERDEATLQTVLARVVTALHRYMDQPAAAARAEQLAAAQIEAAPTPDLRIAWYRALLALAHTPTGFARLKDLLDGRLRAPGVELRPLDRWNMVTTLVAGRDPEGEARLAAEIKRDTSGDARKYAYVAEAARPDAATKKRYFDEYLHNTARPEDWVEASLAAFNWWSQAELTRPYLRAALEALPQVKRQRKIFFVLAWLNAFLGAQHSPEAEAIVRDFLSSTKLDADLRLKVLEVNDELQRAVRIRQRTPR